MNEFSVQIKQPVIITGNFEEMKADLSNMMTAYAGLEVTEDNIPERKKDVATLRKIKTAIEDKRKAAKKDYEKPFKAFEQECKSLTGIIDTEIDRINKALDVYEEKRKADKRLLIAQIYSQNIGEYVDYLPLESIYRPQWENKTCTENEIIFSMQEQIATVRKDIETINSMCAPWIDQCLEAYKKYGNSLTSALTRYKDLESAKEAAEKAVQGGEQSTHTDTPGSPENPIQRPTDPSEWTFEITVRSAEDAKFIRDTCAIMGFDYKEV